MGIEDVLRTYRERITPKFYCCCNEDCKKCPKPPHIRGVCIKPRATDCRHMSSPEICPCLRIEVER